ncbi:unnamed protein product [Euphydryas editha]|uniref:Uncharacterized protein n=1 Tax=Euphydryas editha TaxID=104508 RepID=A0AAU9U7K3_EUPED|nr:unnamed protein product [Euphydryas editha]
MSLDFSAAKYITLMERFIWPQWRDCKYKIIPDEEISKYMPPLNESCKLLFSHADWKTINKFQAAKINGKYS